jgi:hypothetical protein
VIFEKTLACVSVGGGGGGCGISVLFVTISNNDPHVQSAAPHMYACCVHMTALCLLEACAASVHYPMH